MIGESGESLFEGTGLFAKIRRNVEAIRRIVTDSGSLAVVSSGSVRSNHIAGMIVEDPWIAGHSVERDFLSAPALVHGTLADEDTTAEGFAAQIEPFASKISAKSVDTEPAAMILVAGPAVVAGLSEKQGIEFEGAVEIGPLAMNHFSIDFPTAG